MFDTAVTNASPLIYLGRTGNLHLLQSCARNVCVPWARGTLRAVGLHARSLSSTARVHGEGLTVIVQVDDAAVIVWIVLAG